MNPAVVLPFIDRHLPELVQLTRQPGLPSPSTIRIQLSKILKSDGFIRAARMRRFLEFVVEETLAGRAGQLCEYSIGISVFRRGESFEPGLDPIVRNDARRLRQKLLEYYQRSHRREGDRVIIDIPKGRYVPVFSSALRSQGARSGPYRLSMTLTRVADGAEIWSAEHDFTLA
jgi:hypothetical protein